MKMTRLLLAVIIACISFVARGQGVTIPNLTNASALTGPEQFPAVQAGGAVKVTASQIQSFLEGSSNTWNLPQQFNGTGSAPAITATSVGTTNDQVWQQSGNSPNGQIELGFDGFGNSYFYNTAPGNSLYLGSYLSGSVVLVTSNTSRLYANSQGNVTINPPSSGPSLTVTTAGNTQDALDITDTLNSSAKLAMSFDAGGNSYVQSRNGTTLVVGSTGTGQLDLLTGGGGAVVSAAGNWNFSAPSSGAAVTVNVLDNSAGTYITDGTVQAGTEITNTPGLAFEFGTFSNHALQFFTDNAIRGVISAAGNWTIDAPSSGPALSVNGIQAGGGVTGYVCWNSLNGALTYDTVAACPASSERFKTDIRALNAALGEVERLHSISYHPRAQYDPQYRGKKEQLGFLAEEVAKVDPRLVEFDKHGKPLTVVYDRVTVLLVEALQEEHRHVLELAAAVLALILWNACLTYRVRALQEKPSLTA